MTMGIAVQISIRGVGTFWAVVMVCTSAFLLFFLYLWYFKPRFQTVTALMLCVAETCFIRLTFASPSECVFLISIMSNAILWIRLLPEFDMFRPSLAQHQQSGIKDRCNSNRRITPKEDCLHFLDPQYALLPRISSASRYARSSPCFCKSALSCSSGQLRTQSSVQIFGRGELQLRTVCMNLLLKRLWMMVSWIGWRTTSIHWIALCEARPVLWRSIRYWKLR